MAVPMLKVIYTNVTDQDIYVYESKNDIPIKHNLKTEKTEIIRPHSHQPWMNESPAKKMKMDAGADNDSGNAVSPVVDDSLPKIPTSKFLHGLKIPAKETVQEERRLGTALRFWSINGQSAFGVVRYSLSGGIIYAPSHERKPRVILAPPKPSKDAKKDSQSESITYVDLHANTRSLKAITFETASLRSPFDTRYSVPSFVNFINLSHRKVEMFRMDHYGDRVSYGSIQPGSRVSMNLFTHHPWVFIDEDDERMRAKWEVTRSMIPPNIAASHITSFPPHNNNICKNFHLNSQTGVVNCTGLVFIPPPSANQNCRYDVKLRPEDISLLSLSKLVLRKKRARNGLEWSREEIPEVLVDQLNMEKNREETLTLKEFNRRKDGEERRAIAIYGNLVNHND